MGIVKNNVIILDHYRPSPFQPDPGCDCKSRAVQQLGRDLEVSSRTGRSLELAHGSDCPGALAELAKIARRSLLETVRSEAAHASV